MFDNILRPEITAVFTPRSPEVNDRMYIQRAELEKLLARALTGSLHPFIYGDSGSGKTWLYKKVLERNGWSEFVANCANADRFGSLTQEIFHVCVEPHALSLKGVAESKIGKISAIAIEGELNTTRNYDAAHKEPLLTAFESLARRSKQRKPILVLDNLESIFSNSTLMNELADIITVTDDARYSKTGIKLIIVGTPSGVAEYFSRTKNRATVANRLRELPRVGNLSSSQVKLFVKKGFKDLLRADVLDPLLDSWALHIDRVTLV